MSAFRHIAGDVLWHTQPLTLDDAEAVKNVFRDEAKAAWRAGDLAAHEQAAILHAELFTALHEARKWARAGAPTNTERRAA